LCFIISRNVKLIFFATTVFPSSCALSHTLDLAGMVNGHLFVYINPLKTKRICFI
jgi:hypothetical protein